MSSVLSGLSDTQNEMETLANESMNFTVDQIKELIAFRVHFGELNFYNIVKIFYILSHVTDEVQNNPFKLVMD